ncbi:LOW QUALITY PROTEIN: hypothetical protein Cgig2_032282 [Carnegiea gigantea]|uniref:Uncharacterized protein n=1 Tax=Carnegiea gigantea TaxID=171969 RepID=A0A9Q1GKY7_9CARY|nr:LOW QUALITY PROTEIN: hypothetical protein Cgig2_032282 [Carnegiea gigantea]
MHFTSSSFTVASASGITKVYPAVGDTSSRGSSSLRCERPLDWGNDSQTILRVRAGRGPRKLRPLRHDLWDRLHLGMTPILKYRPRSGPSRGKELVDVPSEDELLDYPSEEWEDVPPKEELVLVDTTIATDLEELGAEERLPSRVLSASSSSVDLIREVDLIFTILHT